MTIWDKAKMTRKEWMNLTFGQRDNIIRDLYNPHGRKEVGSFGYARLLDSFFTSEAHKKWEDGRKSFAPWET